MKGAFTTYLLYTCVEVKYAVFKTASYWLENELAKIILKSGSENV